MRRFLPVRLHNVRVVRPLIQGVWFLIYPFPCPVVPVYVVPPRVVVRSFVVVPVTAFGTVRFGSAVVRLHWQCSLPSQLLQWLLVHFRPRFLLWWVLPCVWLLRQPFHPRRLDQRVGLGCVA